MGAHRHPDRTHNVITKDTCPAMPGPMPLGKYLEMRQALTNRNRQRLIEASGWPDDWVPDEHKALINELSEDLTPTTVKRLAQFITDVCHYAADGWGSEPKYVGPTDATASEDR